jgi:putative inorganic carbon (hco3(-)) transporter
LTTFTNADDGWPPGQTAAGVVRRATAPAIIVPVAVALLFANVPVVIAGHLGVSSLLLGVGLLGALSIAAIRVLLVDRRSLAIPAAFPWLLLYMAAVTISGVVSQYPGESFDALMAFLGEGLLLYVLLVNVVRDESTLRRTLWAVSLVAAALALLSVFQAVTGAYDTTFLGFSDFRGAEGEAATLAELRTRASGPIGAPNRWAQVLLMVIPIPLVVGMRHPRAMVRMAGFILTLACAAGIALTTSRGAMVAGIALFITMIALREVRAVGMVAVAIGVTLLLLIFPRAVDRLTKTTEAFQSSDPIENVDGAVIGRLSSNIGALRVFSDHPIVGVGIGNYPLYHRDAVEDVGLRVVPNRQPHNLYPQIGAESGVLGLATFGGIMIATLRETWRTRQRSRPGSDLRIFAGGMFLGVLTYLYSAMFLHLAFQRYFWLLLALSAAVTVVADESPVPDT